MGVLVTASFAALVVPVIGQFSIEFAKERGWYDAPSARVASILETLAPITGSWWFLVSLGFCGGAAGAYWVSEAWPRRRPVAKSALLELEIYGPGRNPHSIREENIARWCFIEAVYRIGQQARQIPHTFIVVVFDDPIIKPRFSVISQGMVLPQHEVRFGDDRFAFIIIDGHVPAGNITISVRARPKP